MDMEHCPAQIFHGGKIKGKPDSKCSMFSLAKTLILAVSLFEDLAYISYQGPRYCSLITPSQAFETNELGIIEN